MPVRQFWGFSPWRWRIFSLKRDHFWRKSRWWFQICFIFIPIWGSFQFWLIFFRWVETTNYKWIIVQALFFRGYAICLVCGGVSHRTPWDPNRGPVFHVPKRNPKRFVGLRVGWLSPGKCQGGGVHNSWTKISSCWRQRNFGYRVLKGPGMSKGGGSLIFPKVPQSSRPESSGFPSYVREAPKDTKGNDEESETKSRLPLGELS